MILVLLTLQGVILLVPHAAGRGHSGGNSQAGQDENAQHQPHGQHEQGYDPLHFPPSSLFPSRRAWSDADSPAALMASRYPFLTRIRTGPLPGASRGAGVATAGEVLPAAPSQAQHGEELAHLLRPALPAGGGLLIRFLGAAEEGVEAVAAFLAPILEYGHVLPPFLIWLKRYLPPEVQGMIRVKSGEGRFLGQHGHLSSHLRSRPQSGSRPGGHAPGPEFRRLPGTAFTPRKTGFPIRSNATTS